MLLKNFRTYHLAKEFYKDCDKISCKPHMKDQLSRASLSIINNLAEGSARPTSRDRARFYAMSLGSFRECQSILDLLNRNDLLQKYDFLGICLFNLHRYTLTPRQLSP